MDGGRRSLSYACPYTWSHNLVPAVSRGSISRSMQRSHKQFFLLCFFCILLQGFWGLIWTFALRQLDVLAAFTVLLGFFIPVISFTLRLDNFLGSSKALTELNEIRESLGFWFKLLNYQFFMSLFWEWKPTSSRISYSCRRFLASKGGNFLRYSTI